jgi:hypothetical protein
MRNICDEELATKHEVEYSLPDLLTIVRATGNEIGIELDVYRTKFSWAKTPQLLSEELMNLVPQNETQGHHEPYGKSTTWYFSNESANDVETGKMVLHISPGESTLKLERWSSISFPSSQKILKMSGWNMLMSLK